MSEQNDTLIDDSDALDAAELEVALDAPEGVPEGFEYVGEDRRGLVYQRVEERVVPVPPRQVPERIPLPEIRPAEHVSLKWDHHFGTVLSTAQTPASIARKQRRTERKRAKVCQRAAKALPEGISLDMDSQFAVGQAITSNSKRRLAAGGMAGIALAVVIGIVLVVTGQVRVNDTRTEYRDRYLSAPNESAGVLESWVNGTQAGSLLPEEIAEARRAIAADKEGE